MVTGWSQVVTFVTGKVKDLMNDVLDSYYGPMASNQELVIRVGRRNASLIDLLASPQVKTLPGHKLATPGHQLATPGDHLATPGHHLATPGNQKRAPLRPKLQPLHSGAT